MKKADFLLEVMAELNNIKAKATKEEIGRLNLESFNPNSPTKCIYGVIHLADNNLPRVLWNVSPHWRNICIWSKKLHTQKSLTI